MTPAERGTIAEHERVWMVRMMWLFALILFGCMCALYVTHRGSQEPPYMTDYAILGDNPNYSRFIVRDEHACILVVQATNQGIAVAMTSQPWHCD